MTDTTKDTKSEDKDRSAELSDALEAPAFVFAGYRESEDHVPDPFFQSGNLDTSDTAGSANNSIKEISPIFDVARVQNMRTAARALDPEDDGVPAELVTLPQGQVTVMGTTKTADEGRDDVINAVLKAAENPPEVGGMSPAQKIAAEDASEKEDGKAEGKNERKSSIAGDDIVGHTSDSYARQREANERREAETKKDEGKDAQSTPKVESK